MGTGIPGLWEGRKLDTEHFEDYSDKSPGFKNPVELIDRILALPSCQSGADFGKSTITFNATPRGR
jgi:hypothetical protein